MHSFSWSSRVLSHNLLLKCNSKCDINAIVTACGDETTIFINYKHWISLSDCRFRRKNLNIYWDLCKIVDDERWECLVSGQKKIIQLKMGSEKKVIKGHNNLSFTHISVVYAVWWSVSIISFLLLRTSSSSDEIEFIINIYFRIISKNDLLKVSITPYDTSSHHLNLWMKHFHIHSCVRPFLLWRVHIFTRNSQRMTYF